MIRKRESQRRELAALSHDALLAKARLYTQRALRAKQHNEEDIYQLWAALALEILAKASLAAIHPSLVVETANPNSLLEANGISTGTAVRTVDANVAFSRLRHTVPNFGTPIGEACRSLLTRRNAELHSGHAAFSGIPLASWEGDFWSAIQLILASMKSDLDAWLGADSRAPKELLDHLSHAKREAAKQRVAHAAEMFAVGAEGAKRSKNEKEELRLASKRIVWSEVQGRFRYSADKEWRRNCPACCASGFLCGDKVSEDVVENSSRLDPGWELVEIEYSPIEFLCPTCGLELDGREALEVAGLDEIHVEEEEREIEYEPEYGND